MEEKELENELHSKEAELTELMLKEREYNHEIEDLEKELTEKKNRIELLKNYERECVELRKEYEHKLV